MKGPGTAGGRSANRSASGTGGGNGAGPAAHEHDAHVVGGAFIGEAGESGRVLGGARRVLAGGARRHRVDDDGHWPPAKHAHALRLRRFAAVAGGSPARAHCGGAHGDVEEVLDGGFLHIQVAARTGHARRQIFGKVLRFCVARARRKARQHFPLRP